MLRKQRVVKKLTADELKSKLFSHFHKTGSFSRMRTELRGKLMSELLKVSSPIKASETDEVHLDFEKSLLPLQVTNWLVYDHLSKEGHQYALSMFATEASLSDPKNMLAARDILSLFGLDSTTPEYKSISDMYSTHKSSYSLLLAVIKSFIDSSHSTQPPTSDPTDTQSADIHTSTSAVQDNKQETLFNTETRSQFQKAEDSVFIAKLQMAVKEGERENQSLRQRLVQEVDRLHAQERAQNMEVEQERLQLKKERDVLSSEKENLKEKELLLFKEYENKLQRRIRELESDFSSKMNLKDMSLEDLQNRLVVKEQRLKKVEEDFVRRQTDFETLKKELEHMQVIHKNIYEQYSSLVNDNTNLLKKFGSMSDYTAIKNELQNKSTQVSKLHQEIQDLTSSMETERGSLTDIVKSLQAKLSEKENELADLKRQLKITKDTAHMRETAWSKERRNMEQDNLAAMDMCKIFSQKLEAVKEDMHALQQRVHFLPLQLAERECRRCSTPESPPRQRVAFATPEKKKGQADIFRINFKESPSKYEENPLRFLDEAKKNATSTKGYNEIQDKCSVIYSSLPQMNSPFITTVPYNVTRNQIVSCPLSSEDNFNGSSEFEASALDLSFSANLKEYIASSKADTCIGRTIEPREMMIESTLRGPYNALRYSGDQFSSNTAYCASNSTGVTEYKYAPFQGNSIPKESSISNQNLGKSTGDINLTENRLAQGAVHRTTSQIQKDVSARNDVQVSAQLEKKSVAEKEESLAPSVAPTISSQVTKEETDFHNLPPKLPMTLPDSNESVIAESLPKSIKDSQRSVVIDLDAAWKRKSSLAYLEDPTESNDSRRQLVFVKEDVSDPTLIEKLSHESHKELANKTNLDNVEDFHDIESENDKDSTLQVQSTKQTERDIALNDPIQYGDSLELVQSTKDFLSPDSAQKDSSDTESVKGAASDDKNEDSMSELHFSCGSEQEPQKEDSDNW